MNTSKQTAEVTIEPYKYLEIFVILSSVFCRLPPCPSYYSDNTREVL